MRNQNSVTEDFAVGLGATIIGLIVFGIVIAFGFAAWEVLRVFAANIKTLAIVLGVIIVCGLLFVMFALFGRFIRQNAFRQNRN